MSMSARGLFVRSAVDLYVRLLATPCVGLLAWFRAVIELPEGRLRGKCYWLVRWSYNACAGGPESDGVFICG